MENGHRNGNGLPQCKDLSLERRPSRPNHAALGRLASNARNESTFIRCRDSGHVVGDAPTPSGDFLKIPGILDSTAAWPGLART
jgi:hypothetical protein